MMNILKEKEESPQDGPSRNLIITIGGQITEKIAKVRNIGHKLRPGIEDQIRELPPHPPFLLPVVENQRNDHRQSSGLIMLLQKQFPDSDLIPQQVKGYPSLW
jgi:hypothetical protein